jgi:hypothetical protein
MRYGQLSIYVEYGNLIIAFNWIIIIIIIIITTTTTTNNNNNNKFNSAIPTSKSVQRHS